MSKLFMSYKELLLVFYVPRFYLHLMINFIVIELHNKYLLWHILQFGFVLSNLLELERYFEMGQLNRRAVSLYHMFLN